MVHFPKRWRKIPHKRLADLYRNGSVIFHHPFKLFYQIQPAQSEGKSGCKIIISVPKRNIKRAIDRNRIKRQIRESYRLNFNELHQITDERKVQIELLCLYLPNEHTPTSTLSNKVASLLGRLTQLVAQVGAPAVSGVD